MCIYYFGDAKWWIFPSQMVHREHIPVSKTHHGFYIRSETNENAGERQSCKNRVIFKRFDFYYVIYHG